MIRFVGRRIGAGADRGPGDRFERIEPVDPIIPGSGRIAVTTRVAGVNAGRWRVAATPLRQVGGGAGGTARWVLDSSQHPREWTVHTRLPALAYGPGVRQAVWPALVGLGAVVAVLVQAVLLRGAHVDVGAAVGISVAAAGVGFPAAKLWFLTQHRQHPRTFLHSGACIQGFLAGGIGALAILTTLVHLPLGTVLDASTPGLFAGMAIGRPGCWFTGCCAGRPTASRWGLWSSDRRLGCRRIPIQLLEAAVALGIGLVALALWFRPAHPVAGMLFLGAHATYTLARQLLFPLRAEPRATRYGRAATITACAVTLLAALLISIS